MIEFPLLNIIDDDLRDDARLGLRVNLLILGCLLVLITFDLGFLSFFLVAKSSHDDTDDEALMLVPLTLTA